MGILLAKRRILYIGVCATCCLLSKSKASMMSLCSKAAPNCHTGQIKGRYWERERSILLVLVDYMLHKRSYRISSDLFNNHSKIKPTS